MWFVFILLLLVSKQGLSLTNHGCRDFEEFYNSTSGECQKCSYCLSGLVIIVPCKTDADVVCGPFLLHGKTKLFFWTQAPRKPLKQSQSQQGHADATESWKQLAYALMGVLCVLVVGVGIGLIVTWQYMKRKKAASGIDYEGEGEYVVIWRNPDNIPPVQFSPSQNREILVQELLQPGSPPSPQRFRSTRRNRYYRSHRIYRPQRRLMNEYVDDVFESSDSAGSRNSRNILQTIDEDSQDSTGQSTDVPNS